MKRSYRAVLDHLIDYAGLFPPAGLGMSQAVAKYAAYRSDPDRWALARFVVPASRLGEFEAAKRALPAALAGGDRWPLSVLLGPDAGASWAEVERLAPALAVAGVTIASAECRVRAPAEVWAIRSLVPPAVELYLECPAGPGARPLIEAIGAAGAKAKLRTGGIRAEEIPSTETVVEFLVACAGMRVAFKATAGLHHPVRGSYPLTYDAGSPCATMFGYLNLVMAVTLLWTGGTAEQAEAALAADDRARLIASDDACTWGDASCTAEVIERTRREFMMSIGSCSFTDPLSEIRAT
jgi:hypothetical protein